jgi:hypothetical protein
MRESGDALSELAGRRHTAANTLIYPAVLQNAAPHSHSIVPGGFDVTS